MSKSALNIIILLVLTLSSGCVIKNGHICGPQTPVANCDSEINRRLLHPEPPSEYWIKEDKVTEIRGKTGSIVVEILTVAIAALLMMKFPEKTAVKHGEVISIKYKIV